MRVVENKGITLLYISNGIHFKLSSLSANIAENQQVTNLHPDLHPLLVNLGVILHPLFGSTFT